MIHRFLLCMFLLTLVASAQPADSYISGDDRAADSSDKSWSFSYNSDEGGSGSSYMGIDIADVSEERLGELKLKEAHGAEITMVDGDAPAGKAGLQEHDVIVSVNGTAIESAAQLRRIIKETPPGRVVNLGISRDGQAMTIKVQLADRHKSMSWEPNIHVNIPKIEIPPIPDFDLPISVVVVHSGMRSGLMVENITPQLGEFFGVKDGKGVLVRSVEKGSRGEKAGFRAGDVVVKVNNQTVHDTSDFTHALHSTSGSTAAVTVMREKREQNLTLPLPEKKDSGKVLEESFVPEITAEVRQAINLTGDELARVGPAVKEALESSDCWTDVEESLKDRAEEMKDRQEEVREQMEERQQELKEGQEEMRQEQQEREQEMQEQQQELQENLRHGLLGGWAEI
jgi:membrane-associated protease RseP (regulator of RpoE activity)